MRISPAQSRLMHYLTQSPRYKAVQHLLKEAAQMHRLEPELLQALIAAESGFDTQAVSPKGAVGLMQLMPGTAREQAGLLGGLGGEEEFALAGLGGHGE